MKLYHHRTCITKSALKEFSASSIASLHALGWQITSELFSVLESEYLLSEHTAQEDKRCLCKAACRPRLSSTDKVITGTSGGTNKRFPNPF